HAPLLRTTHAVDATAPIPTVTPQPHHATANHIPLLTRAHVQAALTDGNRPVAVAGTHGNTTTTSMISVMCTRLGLDPTFVIGGDLNEIASGAGHGAGDVFVAEADESDGSFLLYEPAVAVGTNIEVDHLDYYPVRAEVDAGFAAFAGRAGSVVAF